MFVVTIVLGGLLAAVAALVMLQRRQIAGLRRSRDRLASRLAGLEVEVCRDCGLQMFEGAERHVCPTEHSGCPHDCPACTVSVNAMIRAVEDPNHDRRFNPVEPVACTWCGWRTAATLGHLQGEHCAASVWCKDGAWFVQGHYGSSFDTLRYRFVRNEPTAAAVDPICDDCVRGRIEAGDLEEVSGSFL